MREEQINKLSKIVFIKLYILYFDVIRRKKIRSRMFKEKITYHLIEIKSDAKAPQKIS